jgi:hypothetical protein
MSETTISRPLTTPSATIGNVLNPKELEVSARLIPGELESLRLTLKCGHQVGLAVAKRSVSQDFCQRAPDQRV